MALNGLDSSKAGLAELLAELPDVVLVLDYSGRVLWGNYTAERMFGRNVDDSIGFSALALVHPEDLELVLRSFASVQRKEIGTLIEVRAKSISGWRLLEVIGAPVTWCGEAAVLFSMRDLTERRRFEVARSEEARFRSLVQNSASMTMLVSPTGTVDSVSGALSRLLGRDPELVEQRPLAELVSPDDRPALAAAFEQASRGATASSPVTVQVRMLRHADDGSVPFELSLVNLLDDPTVAGFVVSAHDITARLVAELEVRKTLSLLNATLESTADGILVVDSAGKITSFNTRFAEMWHLPESVLSSREDAAALSLALGQLKEPEAFEARVTELYANPEAESYDSFEFSDGRVFERYSRPQRVDGVIVGRVWSFRDVTGARRTEAVLRESEQRFRQVFNQGPLAIALVDLDSCVTNANRALCRLLKRSRNELVGGSFEPVTHPDDVEKDRELAGQMSVGDIPSYRTETRFVTSNGDVVFGVVTASMIRGELGRPIYGLRIIEDITERKRFELELTSHATTAGKLLASLTPREVEVLEQLADAITTSKIAEHLSVSVRTVETHLANAYRKLGVRNREDASAQFSSLRRAVAGIPQIL